jgi:hypothetical protein
VARQRTIVEWDASGFSDITAMKGRKVKTDRRLLGTSKSDRRLTFKHFTPSPTSTPAELRRFKAIFGKMLVRWGTRYVYVQLGESNWKDTYEIVAQDSVSVVVRSFNDVLNEDRLSQIFFEEDCYWFWTPWNMREFFRRVR